MIKEMFVDKDYIEVLIDRKNAVGKTIADLCEEIEARKNG